MHTVILLCIIFFICMEERAQRDPAIGRKLPPSMVRLSMAESADQAHLLPPLPPFCPSNGDQEFRDPSLLLRSGLDPSAVSFLDGLGLPAVHPLCLDPIASVSGATDSLPNAIGSEGAGIQGAGFYTLYCHHESGQFWSYGSNLIFKTISKSLELVSFSYII